MTEQPKMTLPNGDVLRDGDWGVTREGEVVQVWITAPQHSYPWSVSDKERRNGIGQMFYNGLSAHDIIASARAPAPSTRPADEMDLTAMCKPNALWHPDTLAEMLAWPHGWEAYCEAGWLNIRANMITSKSRCYRAKPAPTIAPEVQAFADMHNAAKKAGLIT